MGHIPGRKQDRFYEKKLVVELVAVLPALVTAAVGALVNLGDPSRRTLGWWLVGATAWLAIASIVKVLHAAAQDRDRKRGEDHAGLRGALHVLYASVHHAAGPQGGGALRVTIHRIVQPKKKGQGAERLEQLLPYFGGRGGGAERTFPIQSGIIGKAAREKVVVASTRRNANYPEFLDELVSEWAYTEEDARTVTADRHSWMAVPILTDGSAPVAVVYLDSSIPDFFSQGVWDVVVGCCGGITAHIAEVY